MTGPEITFVDPDEVWEKAGFQLSQQGSEDLLELETDSLTEDWDDELDD